MENFKKFEEKYLFNLIMLNGHMSVMDYIIKVVEYEELNGCHIDNKQFHNYNFPVGLSANEEKDDGKINFVK